MINSGKIISVKLKKNLIKSIKQGEPWLYADALLDETYESIALCKVFFKKDHIAWGMYDPNSPLRVRVLSSEKNFSKSKLEESFVKLIIQKKKRNLNEHTNTYRLVNGEGDFFPGLVIDVYGEAAVLQADGEGPYQFYDWQHIASLLTENSICKKVFYKARNQHKVPSKYLTGEGSTLVETLENGCKILVDFSEGQKTGFFIDQKLNRNYLRTISKDKSVLNLFSYTGGFSVSAGLGGAKRVVSVDIAAPAADLAHKNWLLNGLAEKDHSSLAINVFDYLEKDQEKFDIVVCDPPSFSNKEKDKSKAVNAYVDVFSKAAKKLKPGGALILSSCSSHISYEDFFKIARESVSQVKKKGKVVFMGSQAPGHSYPLAFLQMQYLKFLHIDLVE